MRTIGISVILTLSFALGLMLRAAPIPPQIIVLPVPVEHPEPCWDARQLDTYRSLLDACHGRMGRCLDLLELARDGGR